MIAGPRYISEGLIALSVVFYISFNKVCLFFFFFVFFRRLAHLLLSVLNLYQFSLVWFCLNLFLMCGISIIALCWSLVTEPCEFQTQLHWENPLHISKAMAHVHFYQFL